MGPIPIVGSIIDRCEKQRALRSLYFHFLEAEKWLNSGMSEQNRM